jgi:acetylornithine deacetylase/succinyl-diaminopimelate desuccinylase-like protein
MAILGEPTANAIGLSNLGVHWARLSTRGTMAHTQHASTASNAIERMLEVIPALHEWCASYRQRHEYEGIHPSCDITAIDGGLPWRLSRTPVACSVFLCVRSIPTTSVDLIRSELEVLVAEFGERQPPIELNLEIYLSHPGTAIDADEPVVRALHKNHRVVFGVDPVYRPRTAYMDSTPLNLLGIPTVVYGPSGRVNDASRGYGWSPEQGEHIALQDLRLGTEVVARSVVDLCG